MVAHRFGQFRLQIDETLVQGRWILAIQGDHLGPRLPAADKASCSIPSMTAAAITLAGSRVNPSSGPAPDERIMGVSVAPG
jgi:anti-sigma factor RsiW